MKGNFLAFLFRALTHTRGHFMLSRVLLNRIKKEASSSSLGLDNRNYKLIIPGSCQVDTSIISKNSRIFFLVGIKSFILR